jgi:hypothetical protein
MPGRIFDGLDKLVDATVRLCSGLFQVKSFTRSWLTLGLMIAYVYLICLLILFLMRLALRMTVDLLGWSNVLGLRNAIAKERGIAAYRAWLPLERIRPADVPQEQWEETFAWPANNKPPYPPLPYRFLRALASYLLLFLAAVLLLQLFSPFPALSWLGSLIEMLIRSWHGGELPASLSAMIGRIIDYFR